MVEAQVIVDTDPDTEGWEDFRISYDREEHWKDF